MYVSFEEAYEEFKIFAAKRQKKQSFDTLHYNFKKLISILNHISMF